MKPPKISFDLGLTKNSVLNPVHFGYWHSTSALCDLRFLWSSSTFPFVYIVCLHRLFTFCFCWFDAKFILLLRRRKSSVLPVQSVTVRFVPSFSTPCVLWLKSKPRLYCTPGTSWYLKEIAQRIKAIMSPYWRNWIVPRQFFDILNWAFQKHFCIEVWTVLNLEK